MSKEQKKEVKVETPKEEPKKVKEDKELKKVDESLNVTKLLKFRQAFRIFKKIHPAAERWNPEGVQVYAEKKLDKKTEATKEEWFAVFKKY